MKKAWHGILCIFAALAAFSIHSCSDGGGDSTESAGTPGVVSGVITGFGSIFVNRRELETETAQIQIEDAPGVESDLGLGMVVVVDAMLDDSGGGRALSIRADSELEGIVDSVDVAASRLTVLGQTVLVDGLTVLDGTTLDTLAPGNVIKVSGFAGADGAIQATRIELRSPSFVSGTHEIEIHGTIAALDPAGRLFNIRDLRVSFADAVLQDIPGGELQNGLAVEVKSSAGLAGGVLIASRVEGKSDDDLGAPGDQVEIEGLVRLIEAGGDFEVAGRMVRTTASTVFENGTSADLISGVKVEVKGVVEDGVIVARRVSFRRASTVRIEAPVESVTDSAMVLLGITVRIDSQTLTRDRESDDYSRLSLGDISEGDWLEVRGFLQGDVVLAARVERDRAESSVILQAPATRLAGDAIEILGVTVSIDAQTEFDDVADQSISREDFFAALGEGTLVKARGVLAGGGIRAEELELEAEED